MASQPDCDTTQMEIPVKGAEAVSEKRQVAASDFDAILLFPSEGKLPAGAPAHTIVFPDSYVRPPAPAPDPIADTGTRKTSALSDQKPLRDSVAIEVERLSALARVHASQSAQLNEGYRHAARIKELLAWAEELAAKTAAQLEQITKVTDDLATALGRFDREAQALSESLANRVDRLNVRGSVVKQTEGGPPGRRGLWISYPGWRALWISYRRWMVCTVTALVAHTPPWTARRGARALGWLGVLALVGGVFMRLPGDADRLRTNEAVLQTPPLPSVSASGMGWFGTLAPGTRTVLDESHRVADVKKPPVQAKPSVQTKPRVQAKPPVQTKPSVQTQPPVQTREFFGNLEVQSNPSGATVFVKGQPVGTTPVRLERLSAGTHAVRVEGVGYEAWTSAVLVPADKLTRVNANLQREVPAASGRQVVP